MDNIVILKHHKMLSHDFTNKYEDNMLWVELGRPTINDKMYKNLDRQSGPETLEWCHQ